MGSASDDLTVRCRRLYERRMKAAERLRQTLGRQSEENAEITSGKINQAMVQLRKEIATLMNEDNSLFRQLLSLNDKIEELKVQQQQSPLEDDEEEAEDDEEEETRSRCGSLDSLSDADGTVADQSASPTSTLSSSSSACTLRTQRISLLRPNGRVTLNRFECQVARPLQIVTKDDTGRLVLVRSYKDVQSIASSGVDAIGTAAYDSGFHGSESDAENEIFV